MPTMPILPSMPILPTRPKKEKKTQKQNNMENYDDFFSVRRSWSKGALAMMYFPDARSVKSATNRLARWLKLCVGLLPALQETGYTPKQKRLTPRQVEIIFYYLGEPGE